MELNELIPYRFRNVGDSKWNTKGKFLMFKKLQYIPVAFIQEEIVYILLDYRVKRPMIELIKHVMSLKKEFYFLTPEVSNPSGVEDFHEKVIRNYFLSYIKDDFYREFRKINLDIIDNMVKWSEKENCFHIVKEVHDEVSKKVNSHSWDFYSRKNHYNYSEEIRDNFKTLYRDILISKIL